jgi:hypothetical protein
MSVELAFDVVCKVCGEPGKVLLDLDAFAASCEEQGLKEQEGAEAFAAALEGGKLSYLACEASQN